MSLSLLFLKRTDKQGWFRNIVTLIAIVLATTVLLSAMAVGNAMSEQADRNDRLSRLASLSGKTIQEKLEDNGDGVILSDNSFDLNKQMVREIGLRPVSKHSPLLRGLPRYPEEGEIFVSSALKEAIEKDELWRDRYANTKVLLGVPDFYLGSPDQKVAFYRINDQNFANNYNSMKLLDERSLTASKKTLSEASRNRLRRRITEVFMLVCGLGFCFPLLILAISATRVGVIQREQRYASLSLIGASKKQINRMILFETLITAGLGVMLGTGLYFVVNHLVLQKMSFDNQRFFASELTISTPVFIAIVVLVLMVSLLVNWLALRKVKTSPLGVAKHQKRLRKPSLWRILPLLAASVWVYWLNHRDKEWFMKSADSSMLHFAGIFLLTMFGLLIIGPYLTYILAKLIGRFSRGATVILASKRLQAFAGPIYSSVSGVVLALFVGTFFMSSLASVEASYSEFYKNQTTYSQLASRQVSDKTLRLDRIRDSVKDDDLIRLETLIKNHNQLNKTVLKIKPLYHVYEMPVETSDDSVRIRSGQVYTCAELLELTQLTCPVHLKSEEQVVLVMDFEGAKQDIVLMSDLKNPKISINSVALTFANPNEAKRARTQIENLISQEFRQAGNLWYIRSDDDTFDIMSRVAGLVDVILVGTVLTVIVASLSLAVATISGFFERKRSFFTLRLMGFDVSRLNRVIMLEAFVPLVLASIVALITGAFLVNYLLRVTSMEFFIFKLPEVRYFIIVGLSFVATFVIIALILPLLKRITNFENNRTE